MKSFVLALIFLASQAQASWFQSMMNRLPPEVKPYSEFTSAQITDAVRDEAKTELGEVKDLKCADGKLIGITYDASFGHVIDMLTRDQSGRATRFLSVLDGDMVCYAKADGPQSSLAPVGGYHDCVVPTKMIRMFDACCASSCASIIQKEIGQ